MFFFSFREAALVRQMSDHIFRLFYLKCRMRFAVTSGLTCFSALRFMCFCVMMTSHWYCFTIAAMGNMHVFVHFLKQSVLTHPQHLNVQQLCVQWNTWFQCSVCISMFSGDVGNHSAWVFRLARLQIQAFCCAFFMPMYSFGLRRF